MMVYSSAYSTATEWMRGTTGITDLGGASSLMFVKDGVALLMNAHPTLVFIFNAPKAAPWRTH